MEENLKKTCLNDSHVALGAKMSPFAGFMMPIQYSSITEEHNAVRHAVGMFDVSHMGEIFVNGPDAEKFVNHIFTLNFELGTFPLNFELGTLNFMISFFYKHPITISL